MKDVIERLKNSELSLDKQLAIVVMLLAEEYPTAIYEKLVATYKHYYSGCYYDAGVVRLENGVCLPECGCIFGHALRLLGRPVPSNLVPISRIVEVRSAIERSDLVDTLQEVQNSQDRGLTWGSAVKELKLKYGDLLTEVGRGE